MLQYPVTLVPDEGTYLVDFVDFPDVHSVGDTVEEALREAVDGLLTGIEMYMDARLPIPLPSALATGQHYVALPADEATKIRQWNASLAA